MLRKESEAVLEGNGPVPQKEEFGSGQPTWENVYRMMKEAFDRWDRKLDEMLENYEEYIEERTSIDQRLTRLEHGARQPHFAMETDGHANTKTQERTEGAATAVQAMRGDSCTTEQKVQDGPKTSIAFGVEADAPFGRGGRYVARVVSPILGDALTNNRRWLSSHRRSLHSQGDHLQRATSSVLRDRGDESRGGLEDGKFMDFDSIRLVRQQQLLETACCSLLPEGR